MHAGRLRVNGRLCSEPYLEDPGDLEILPGKIPANSYALIGDKRPGTVVAMVNRRRIMGKVVCRKAPRARSLSTAVPGRSSKPRVNYSGSGTGNTPQGHAETNLNWSQSARQKFSSRHSDHDNADDLGHL
jgi:hypothetical protein